MKLKRYVEFALLGVKVYHSKYLSVMGRKSIKCVREFEEYAKEVLGYTTATKVVNSLIERRTVEGIDKVGHTVIKRYVNLVKLWRESE